MPLNKKKESDTSSKSVIELVNLRKATKLRKPSYRRQDSHKKSRIGRGRKKLLKWRKPKGTDSKVRLRIKGHLRMPEIGYGSPKKIKGLIYYNGLLIKPTNIVNLKQLNTLDKTDVGVISSSIGLKKKVEIVKKAKEKGITLINISDDFLSKVDSIMQAKKDKRKRYEEHRKKREEKKKVKEEDIKKKEAEKKKETEKKEMMKQVEKTEVGKEKLTKAPKKVEIHRQTLEK